MSAPTMSAEALEVLEALERLAAVCEICGRWNDDLSEMRTGASEQAYICCCCADDGKFYGCEVCDQYIHEIDLAEFDDMTGMDFVCEWCYSEWEKDKEERARAS